MDANSHPLEAKPTKREVKHEEKAIAKPAGPDYH
jgi:hypothetical protein